MKILEGENVLLSLLSVSDLLYETSYLHKRRPTPRSRNSLFLPCPFSEVHVGVNQRNEIH